MKRLVNVWAGIGLVFCLFLSVYWLSGTSGATGFGDSDELLVTSFLGGVAHPPGYAVLTTMAGMVMRLFTLWSPALVGNRLAGVLMAVGMAGVFATASELMALFKIEGLKRVWLSLMVAGLIGFSFSVWLYGTIFEVGPMTVAIASWLMWSAIRWSRITTIHGWDTGWVYVTAGILGLGLAHYPLLVLVIPGMLILFVGTLLELNITVKRIGLVLGKGFLVAMAVCILALIPLWLQIQRQAEVSWYAPVNLTGFLRHVLLQDLGGYSFERQTEFSLVHNQLWNSTRALVAVTEYSLRLIDEFGMATVLLSFGGMGWVFTRDKRLGWAVLLNFALTGPVLAWYMGPAPEFMSDFFAGIASRQFLLNTVVIGIGLALGLVGTVEYLQTVRSGKRLAKLLCWGMMVFVVGWQVWNNRYVMTESRSRNLTALYAQMFLDQADEEAVIICTTDVTCYSLLYAIEVEQMRPDVLVLPHVSTYRVWYHQKRGDDMPLQQPDYLKALVERYSGERPLYLTDGLGEYADYIGWERGPYYLQPNGWGFTILTERPELPLNRPAAFFAVNDDVPSDARDLLGLGIRDVFSNTQAYAGYLSLMYGDAEAATEYLATSVNLDPNNTQARNLLENIETYADTLKL